MTFVARPVPIPGRPGNWRVYDTVTASYPYDRPGLGSVKQDASQPEAEAEAFRLNHPDARPTNEWDFDF